MASECCIRLTLLCCPLNVAAVDGYSNNYDVIHQRTPCVELDGTGAGGKHNIERRQ